MTHDPLCAISSTRCGGRDMKHHSLWSEPPAECEKCGAECDCDLIAKVRADERSRIADAVAELMIAHPYEYPSDYAEADREWIKAGCPRDAIDALKEKQ